MIYITGSFLKKYSVDGFALDVIDYLKRLNIPFRISSHSCIDRTVLGSDCALIEERPKDSFQLLINPTCFLGHYGVDSKTIVYTMWDTSVLDIQYVNQLNKARLCLVPSEANKECFENSGVYVPIEVIPHCYPHEYYRDTPHPRSMWKTLLFGTAGQIVGNPETDKKNIQGVIDCFLRAFPGSEDVTLTIKISPQSQRPHVPSNERRVVIIQEDLDEFHMQEWHQSLYCYVNMSRYEAFGQHVLKAIAANVPVITPVHGGIKDYFKPHMGFKVGHVHRKPTSEIFTQGLWSEPNRDEVVSTMRTIYENRWVLSTKNNKGIQEFSQDVFESNLLGILWRFIHAR